MIQKGEIQCGYCSECRISTHHVFDGCTYCIAKKERKMKEWDKNEATVSSTGSVRHNKDKPEMSQLDPRFVMAMAELLTEADKCGKYDTYNWAKGQKYTVVYDSLMRHMTAFMTGEDMDPESEKSHLIHAACNIMFLWNNWMQENPEFDDRFFKEKK